MINNANQLTSQRIHTNSLGDPEGCSRCSHHTGHLVAHAETRHAVADRRSSFSVAGHIPEELRRTAEQEEDNPAGRTLADRTLEGDLAVDNLERNLEDTGCTGLTL